MTEKINTPKVVGMEQHQKNLGNVLSRVHSSSLFFRYPMILRNNFKHMTSLKRGTLVVSAFAFVIIVGAGAFGPSASQTAHAEAQNIMTRSHEKFKNLTDEQRAELEEKFKNNVHFKMRPGGDFKGFVKLTPEELETKHLEQKASLQESYLEAKSAIDLRILSAEEMPRPGFIGKAGRAFGFKMKGRLHPNEMANLPSDLKVKMEENRARMEENKPVTFLVYTNSEGEEITIGVNAKDAPVMKFIQPKEGEFPQFIK